MPQRLAQATGSGGNPNPYLPPNVAIAIPRELGTKERPGDVAARLSATVALLERRGYSLPPAALGRLCIGGSISERYVLESLPAAGGLAVHQGIVCSATFKGRVAAVAARQRGHPAIAPLYEAEAIRFARRLTALFPFVIAVSLAGSLASGGFAETDDVDLNLVVADGHRHLAYFCLNALGVLHALRHRSKPVDALSARPISPRVMTANLILERSQCFPLARTDADMAFELLSSRALVGARFLALVVAANPPLLAAFPQLAEPAPVPPSVEDAGARLPLYLFPSFLDGPARVAGRAAWRYLQWTRRHHPEALRRVEFVRLTMRPYTLFDDPL